MACVAPNALLVWAGGTHTFGGTHVDGARVQLRATLYVATLLELLVVSQSQQVFAGVPVLHPATTASVRRQRRAVALNGSVGLAPAVRTRMRS